MSRYDATPLIVALSPSYSDIDRLCPWSPIATGYRLDRTEKVRNSTQKKAPLTFLFGVQAFRDPLLGELPYCFCQNSVKFLRRFALRDKKIDDSSRQQIF